MACLFVVQWERERWFGEGVEEANNLEQSL